MESTLDISDGPETQGSTENTNHLETPAKKECIGIDLTSDINLIISDSDSETEAVSSGVAIEQAQNPTTEANLDPDSSKDEALNGVSKMEENSAVTTDDATSKVNSLSADSKTVLSSTSSSSDEMAGFKLASIVSSATDSTEGCSVTTTTTSNKESSITDVEIDSTPPETVSEDMSIESPAAVINTNAINNLDDSNNLTIADANESENADLSRKRKLDESSDEVQSKQPKIKDDSSLIDTPNSSVSGYVSPGLADTEFDNNSQAIQDWCGVRDKIAEDGSNSLNNKEQMRYADVAMNMNGTDLHVSSKADLASNETKKKELDLASYGLGDAVNISISPERSPVYELIVRQDDNDDLLSLHISRVDRRLDYNADGSRGNSPSSVTSGGLYQLGDKRFSSLSSCTTISSSSSSSGRLSDGGFAIPAPARPRKNSLSKQKNVTIKQVKGHVECYNAVVEIFKQVFQNCGIHESEYMYRSITPPSVDRASDKVDTPKSSRKARTKRAGTPVVQQKLEGQNSPELVNNAVDDVKAKDFNQGTPKSKQLKKNLKSRIEMLRPQSPMPAALILENDEKFGLRVLARWSDKKYYAGRVSEVKDGKKYVIQFDDNRTKTLIEEFVILGDKDELPLKGQSVYASYKEDDYEPGIVQSISKVKDRVIYMINFDVGIMGEVSAEDIYLTEDQARIIKEIQNPTVDNDTTGPNTPKKRGAVDMDNIIHGPRNRGRNGVKSLTPKPGSSGLHKKRGRGPKARHLSESSDKSMSEAPSPAAEELPGIIEDVQGVDPEVQKTPKKIAGALTGPFPVKGLGRLTGRRSSKVGSLCDNSDPETVKTLGPILDGGKLFRSMHFVLTCTDPPKKTPPQAESSDVDSEVAASDCEDAEFNTFPFVKERLRYQIEAAGGKVYSHFEDIPANKYRLCKLVAPRPSHTAKYIQCLAANIQPITHEWIIQCSTNNELCSMAPYELPAGFSIERKKFILWSERVTPKPFSNYLILLCSDNNSFLEFWGRVCKLAGATVRNVDEHGDMAGGSCLITDSDCPIRVTRQAETFKVPLVSTTWVVQSLIVGAVCNFDSSIRFLHNYSEAD